jgi:hypothetical protein
LIITTPELPDPPPPVDGVKAAPPPPEPVFITPEFAV